MSWHLPRGALPFCLGALKLRLEIVKVARCVYDVFCMACCVRSDLVGRFMIFVATHE